MADATQESITELVNPAIQKKLESGNGSNDAETLRKQLKALH